ncbi:MAG: cytochrome P450 [Anaerolineae bacterium]|nr:cytochrome P450 [Anaerolineae bacterium]MCO5208015.1 cytochrome P450 [Anaerolineae bacterium]
MIRTIDSQTMTAPVPTAKRLPVIGALPYVARQPFDYLRNAWRQHGDIFRIDLGVTDAVVLSHPRHVQYVLRDNARNYRKGGNMWTSVRTLFGNGLVVSEGDYWLRQRRMMQPHFHRRYITGLLDLMLTAIDEQMALWPTSAETFNISAAFNDITMRVIVRTMFGTQVTDDEFDRLSTAMTHALDYLLIGIVGESLPKWTPLPGKKRYEAARTTFDEIVYRVIARSRASEDDISLLGMLLGMVDAETGEQMTDEQVRDEVATVFVAGYETTAIALAWAVDFLARDAALQDRLSAEINSVIGQDAPDIIALRSLDLVKRTFQEALRIRPSAWFLPRLTVEDDEIDGFSIPAGTQVALMINHIHHHPEQWEAPERFDPDRFFKDVAQSRHSFAYVPFGAGQRQCIGRDFAYMEGQLILARLLQRYRIRPNGAPAQPDLSTTLRPKGGVHIRLEALGGG